MTTSPTIGLSSSFLLFMHSFKFIKHYYLTAKNIISNY